MSYVTALTGSNLLVVGWSAADDGERADTIIGNKVVGTKATAPHPHDEIVLRESSQVIPVLVIDRKDRNAFAQIKRELQGIIAEFIHRDADDSAADSAARVRTSGEA